MGKKWTSNYRRGSKRRTNFLIAGYLIAANFFGLLPLLTPPTAYAAPSDHFVTTWKTDNTNGVSSNETSITIPTAGGGYNYDVDWDNDGTFDEFGLTGSVTHDFGTVGTYTIRIQGSFPRISFAGGGDSIKIININQWGTGIWTSMQGAFQGAANLTSTATDVPNLSSVTSMSAMFYGALIFNGDLSAWDTSNVTNMSSVFFDAANFNSDISGWNTANVTTMSGMFRGASAFNQNLSSWDTADVQFMNDMFSAPYDPSSFNQDISDWNVSSVINAENMLYNAPLSTTNYDAILEKWSAQTLQPNVPFGANGQTYCWSEGYRQLIIDTYNWTISGDSSACSVTLNGGTSASLTSGSSPNTNVGTVALQGATPRAVNPYVIGCTTPGSDDSYFNIGGASANQLRNTQTLAFDTPLDANADNIYEICVRAFAQNGNVLEQTFAVIIEPLKQITSIEFTQEGADRFLMVTGENLLAGTSYTSGVTTASLVTLNGVALPFCTPPSARTAADWESMGYNPALFSDNPTCYYLLNFKNQPLISDTSVRIMLANGFDTDAHGSVSINGSNVFAFNVPPPSEPEVPVQPPTKPVVSKPPASTEPADTIDEEDVVELPPSVALDGATPTPLSDEPTIPKRPTFSGTAAPFSIVIVTVRSDPVVCETKADENGKWSCTLPSDLPVGQHSVTIAITEENGTITNLGPYKVFVKGGETIDSNSPLVTKKDIMSVAKQETMSPTSVVAAGVLGITVITLAAITVIRRRKHTM